MPISESKVPVDAIYISLVSFQGMSNTASFCTAVIDAAIPAFSNFKVKD